MEGNSAGFIPLARRWWWLLVVCAVGAGFVANFLASRLPPTYEAVVRVLTGPVNTDYGTLRASGELARTYAELATSGPVLEDTLEATGAQVPLDDLRLAVSATSNEITRIVTIRVRDGNREQARALADALAANLQQVSERDRRPQLEQVDRLLVQKELEALSKDRRDAIGDAARRVFDAPEEGRLRVVDPARVAPEPIAPRTSLITLLATIAGLLAAAVIIITREKSRDAIDSDEELSTLAPLPVLASIPAVAGRSLVVNAAGSSRGADSFRLLGTKVASLNGKRPKTIVVAGARPQDRTGGVAANLAAALGESDAGRVLLVDANALTPEVTRLLGLTGEPGYGDLVNDKAWTRTNGSRPPLPVREHDGIDVLPNGSDAPPLLDPEIAKRLLEHVADSADVVIIDAPPVSRSSTTLTLARAADATLLVVSRGTTTRNAVADALASLSLVGANVIGTVIAEPRKLARLPLVS